MRKVAGATAALLLASCHATLGASETTFNLPEGLDEISGLAVASPDSVFAHDDENAIIYEVALADGHIRRAFAFGDPTIEGDFEGIATANGRVYLVTSDGLIYSAAPTANGKRAAYRVHDSGIGSRCEIEGLAESPTPGELLVLCKRSRQEADELRLVIYRWPLETEQAPAEPWLSLPMKGIVRKSERAEFRPSGLEWDAARRKLYVVSGRDRLMLVFDANKHLLEQRRLARKRHPQTEGITIMPDGRLVLADEGAKERSGRLSVYPAP